MNASFWIVFILIFSLPTSLVWAREDIVPGSRYTSARGAALGDAFFPLSETGADALFYQPSTIGKFRGVHFEPLNLSTSFTDGFFSMADQSFYNVVNLQNYKNTLTQNPGNWGGAGMQLVPTISMPFFAAGLLISADEAGQSTSGAINYRSRFQVIPAAGVGTSLAHGLIRVGYSLQWVNESFGVVNAVPAANNLSYTNGLYQGSGFSQNFGFTFTMPYQYLPKFDLVWRNMAQTTYTSSTALLGQASSPTAGLPPTEPNSFDLGFSMSPRIAGKSVLNWSLVYRDAFNVSGTSPLTRVALGLEINLSRTFYLRGGFGSGYPSAGVGFRGKSTEFNAAWYGQELGTGFQQSQLRKWMVQFIVQAF